MGVEMGQRITKILARLDKWVSFSPCAPVVLTFLCRDLLDALRARGFQLNDGIDGSGPRLLPWSRGGGYYFGMLFLSLHSITLPKPYTMSHEQMRAPASLSQTERSS
jgi:hypothetical protein